MIPFSYWIVYYFDFLAVTLELCKTAGSLPSKEEETKKGINMENHATREREREKSNLFWTPAFIQGLKYYFTFFISLRKRFRDTFCQMVKATSAA